MVAGWWYTCDTARHGADAFTSLYLAFLFGTTNSNKFFAYLLPLLNMSSYYTMAVVWKSKRLSLHIERCHVAVGRAVAELDVNRPLLPSLISPLPRMLLPWAIYCPETINYSDSHSDSFQQWLCTYTHLWKKWRTGWSRLLYRLPFEVFGTFVLGGHNVFRNDSKYSFTLCFLRVFSRPQWLH